MKALLRTLSIAALCGVLAIPPVDALGQRNRPTSGVQRSNGSGSRGNVSNGGGRASSSRGNQGNVGTPGGQRPGGGQGGEGNVGTPGGQRPGSGQGNVGTPGGQRPGGGQGGGQGNVGTPGGRRPGSGQGGGQGNVGTPGGQRPGSGQGGGQGNWGNPGGQRPGNNHGGNNHGMSPSGPNRSGYPVANRTPVHRPNYGSPWTSPMPPAHWHPGPRAPRFSSILGFTFGTTLAITLNQLIANSVNVYSYNASEIFLNDVAMLGMIWPEATLFYGPAGGLQRGEFFYTTPYYDTYRYNAVYSSLVAAYGAPVSRSYPTNGMMTTWFGPDGRFVTLRYQPAYGTDGLLRYYTTLSYGY